MDDGPTAPWTPIRLYDAPTMPCCKQGTDCLSSGARASLLRRRACVITSMRCVSVGRAVLHWASGLQVHKPVPAKAMAGPARASHRARRLDFDGCRLGRQRAAGSLQGRNTAHRAKFAAWSAPPASGMGKSCAG